MSIASAPRPNDMPVAQLAHWGEPGHGAHTVQFYAEDPDAIELGLFRVLQEALTNVHRHSGASAADVLICEDAEQVVLEVKDNGRGIPGELLNHFHATGAGMGVGLAGIRERAREFGGKLKLESDSSGTLVRVTIPVTQTVQK